MYRFTKKPSRAFCIGLAVVLLFLQGCGAASGIDPSAETISERSSAAGFLASLVEEESGFIGSNPKTEEAYLYDNAIALYALAEAGAVWHVEKLADAIVYAQEHDRTFHDGRLRNIYLCGNPSVDSGRSVTGGAVPLPGFWRSGKWQEDYYAVSSSTGNMGWTVLALCRASSVVSEEKRSEYIAAAEKAADFLLAFSSRTGGFTAGYEGWDEVQKKAGYKATEHNIALFAAFSALAEIIEDGSPEKAAVYRQAAESARDFALSMYDGELGCFYTGTVENEETINKGVIPLDATALAILAFDGEPGDTAEELAFLKKNMAVGAGYDFSAGDLDGIWNEGTAQMALCFWKLEMPEEYNALLGYLKTQEYKKGGVPAADRDGVSTGFLLSGTQELWEYNNTLSIGATAWYALAQMRINPLEQ